MLYKGCFITSVINGQRQNTRTSIPCQTLYGTVWHYTTLLIEISMTQHNDNLSSLVHCNTPLSLSFFSTLTAQTTALDAVLMASFIGVHHNNQLDVMRQRTLSFIKFCDSYEHKFSLVILNEKTSRNVNKCQHGMTPTKKGSEPNTPPLP